VVFVDRRVQEQELLSSISTKFRRAQVFGQDELGLGKVGQGDKPEIVVLRCDGTRDLRKKLTGEVVLSLVR